MPLAISRFCASRGGSAGGSTGTKARIIAASARTSATARVISSRVIQSAAVEPAEDVPIEREPNEDRGGDCQGGGNKMIARHARQDHGRIGGRPVESAMGQVHEAQGTRHEREAGGEEDEHDAEVQAVERPQGEIR